MTSYTDDLEELPGESLAGLAVTRGQPADNFKHKNVTVTFYARRVAEFTACTQC